MSLTLHRHQSEAVEAARSGKSYVLTTGTGSGKSLAYIVPIVDCVLRENRETGKRLPGVRQGDHRLPDERAGELPGRRAGEEFLRIGYPADGEPVTFARCRRSVNVPRERSWKDPTLVSYVGDSVRLTLS